jgi:hypothetical protein
MYLAFHVRTGGPAYGAAGRAYLPIQNVRQT